MSELYKRVNAEISRVGLYDDDLDFAISCVINTYCFETKEDYYRLAQLVDLDFNTNTVEAY